MATVVDEKQHTDHFNVLLIGNNPIELSDIYNRLICLKDKKFIAEIAFDIKSALKSRLKFKPSFILIDDNIGKPALSKLINSLAHYKETEDVPITILKNSNSGDSVQEAQEYILKEHADGQSLAKALLNSRRLKKTQDLIRKTYYTNKKILKKAFNSL